MMKLASLLLLLTISISLSAQQGARDADAVLNRCGKPLKGDETLYTNTLSTRKLEYERGTLLFTRVGNDGWQFVSGSHKMQQNLTAQQMAQFLPCLPLALADSAAPAPLKPVSPVERIEVSAKHSYQTIIVSTIVALLVLGLGFFLYSRRTPPADDDQ